VSDATESAIGASPGGPVRPRPTGVLAASTVAAIGAGAAVAVQTSVNGHVSVLTGSPVLATAINHGSALLVGVVVALAIGALPRAWRSLRRRRSEIRRWWFLGGLMGFAAVLAIILATPALGVVTVAVAVTLGQLAGSVVADSSGIGPGGRRRLTALRIVGIGVAIVAIVVGALGHLESGDLVLILLIVAGGIVIAIQQAANGWLVVVTGGEWAAMTVINFVVSGVAVGIALLVQVAVAPPDFSALPWWGPLGGILGAAIGVVIAITVRTIGVLSSMLCVAAGQAIASIGADLLFPVAGVGVSAGSILGAVLAVGAVALAGLGSVPRRTPAPGHPHHPVPERAERESKGADEGAEHAD